MKESNMDVLIYKINTLRLQCDRAIICSKYVNHAIAILQGQVRAMIVDIARTLWNNETIGL